MIHSKTMIVFTEVHILVQIIFFGKIVSVKIDGEIKYEDKSNNPSSYNWNR